MNDAILNALLGQISGFTVIIAFIIGVLLYASQRRNETASNKKIDKAEQKLEEQPEKAKYAWDLARVTLERYFSRNLFQVNAIFVLSVVVMVGGFVIIIWGVGQSIQSANALAPAAIATLAGVLTEFIGATFIFVYRSTIQQAMEYLKTLERINSVGMAIQVLDGISDDVANTETTLKNKTKAELVNYIMRQVGPESIK